MTLSQMSASYAASAAVLRSRIADLRAAAHTETDPDAATLLQARIKALLPLLQEAQDLAMLTAQYYDRSYHRHEKYTL